MIHFGIDRLIQIMALPQAASCFANLGSEFMGFTSLR